MIHGRWPPALMKEADAAQRSLALSGRQPETMTADKISASNIVHICQIQIQIVPTKAFSFLQF